MKYFILGIIVIVVIVLAFFEMPNQLGAWKKTELKIEITTRKDSIFGKTSKIYFVPLSGAENITAERERIMRNVEALANGKNKSYPEWDDLISRELAKRWSKEMQP